MCKLVNDRVGRVCATVRLSLATGTVVEGAGLRMEPAHVFVVQLTLRLACIGGKERRVFGEGHLDEELGLQVTAYTCRAP